jgi:hypothetical protein
VNTKTGKSDINIQLLVDSCRQSLNFSDILIDTRVTNDRVVTSNEVMNSYFIELSSLLCSCSSNMTSILTSPISCQNSIITLCSSASLRSHFSTICNSCFQESTNIPVYSSSNYIVSSSPHCRSNIIKSVSLLYLRGLCARPGVAGSSSGSNALIGEGAKIADGLNAGSWSKAGNEMMTNSQICLQYTNSMISSNRIKRLNYIPFQSFHTSSSSSAN